MINGGQMVEWIHGCCFGVREWMQDIETTGAALRCFADHGPLLPGVNVSPLQDPLSHSAFTVPELKIVSTNRSADPTIFGKTTFEKMTPGKTSSIADSLGCVSPIEDLPQASKNSGAPKRPASNGNWIASADLQTLAASANGKVSVPAVRQSGGPLDSITLSSVLAKIEDTEGLAAQGKSVEGIRFTAKAEQPHPAIVARPEAFATMYETLRKKSSRRLDDWVSNSSGEMLVGGGEQKFSTESASHAGFRLANSETRDRPMETQRERETAALDVLASAALEAVMTPAAKALSRTVSGSQPDAAQEQNFVSALDRLAETLNTLEGRLAGSSHALSASKGAEQTDSGEILWLEEEELAGRLQTILKRQARRRGIDLA
ncbi:MAG TPA: hypothetical protein VNV88_12955 [Candidatus Solibacter sp.]|jgi:hypothetical protein|nr:hypothetical protein [Candidatus Solibacter sp.]